MKLATDAGHFQSRLADINADDIGPLFWRRHRRRTSATTYSIILVPEAVKRSLTRE